MDPHINTAYVIPVDSNRCYFSKQQAICVTNDDNTTKTMCVIMLLVFLEPYSKVIMCILQDHEDEVQTEAK